MEKLYVFTPDQYRRLKGTHLSPDEHRFLDLYRDMSKVLKRKGIPDEVRLQQYRQLFNQSMRLKEQVKHGEDKSMPPLPQGNIVYDAPFVPHKVRASNKVAKHWVTHNLNPAEKVPEPHQPVQSVGAFSPMKLRGRTKATQTYPEERLTLKARRRSKPLQEHPPWTATPLRS